MGVCTTWIGGYKFRRRNTERDVDSKLELMLVIQLCGGRGVRKRERERQREGEWSLAKHSLVISVCRQGGGATPARTIRYIDRRPARPTCFPT